MFARLVFQPPSIITNYAQTYFTTLMGVITGGITSNTQLDPAAFNRSASIINTTTPSGWYLVDGQANAIGNVVFSGAGNVSPPHVIASNISDDPTRAKTLYITQTLSANNYVDIAAIPMEGWDRVNKTASNSYISTANLTGLNNNGQVMNSTNNYARAYTLAHHYNYTSTNLTSSVGGMVTIVSSSNTHLLVANYLNSKPPTFLNYYFVSEYTRDDPWNTPANGYPSWYWEGACVPYAPTTGAFLGGAFANNTTPGYGSGNFHQHYGAVCRFYNTSTNSDNTWVPMYDTAGVNNGNSGNPASFIGVINPSNWGITTRYMNWSYFWAGSTNQPTGGGQTADSFVGRYPNPLTRGLAQVSNFINFTGNYNTQRDINKNPAYAVGEVRIQSWAQGNILNSNTIWNGGSISAITPIYAFRAGYNSLDEISFGGNTYMNLILNQAPAGNTFSSNILVLER